MCKQSVFPLTTQLGSCLHSRAFWGALPPKGLLKGGCRTTCFLMALSSWSSHWEIPNNFFFKFCMFYLNYVCWLQIFNSYYLLTSPELVSTHEVPKGRHLYIATLRYNATLWCHYPHFCVLCTLAYSLCNDTKKAWIRGLRPPPTLISDLNQAYMPPPSGSSSWFLKLWSNCFPLWIDRAIYNIYATFKVSISASYFVCVLCVY